MLINGTISLDEQEAECIRIVSSLLRKGNNIAYEQVKELERLMDEGYSLVDAFMESEKSTPEMRDIIDELSVEAQAEEADYIYNMLRIGANDKRGVPIITEDNRLVFSDMPVHDVETFLEAMLMRDEWTGFNYEEVDDALKTPEVIKRLDNLSAVCSVILKMTALVKSHLPFDDEKDEKNED